MSKKTFVEAYSTGVAPHQLSLLSEAGNDVRNLAARLDVLNGFIVDAHSVVSELSNEEFITWALGWFQGVSST